MTPTEPHLDGDRAGPVTHAARILFPGYFAVVMATGTLSIALSLHGFPGTAQTLLVVNVAAYAVLWGLLAIRILRFPDALRADVANHARAPGFLTIVAATCVLGTQTVVVAGAPGIGYGLWLFGCMLWGVIVYTFFLVVCVRAEKPDFEIGINGAWLLVAVATQSVAVLAARLHGAGTGEIVQTFALGMFLLGCMLYISIITLIFYRLTFVRITVAQVTPPYWINMGATAITTLAGSELILRADAWELIAEMLPFLKGFTLFFWAAATWWIPLLIMLGLWRHGWHRDPVRYDPQMWSMVFPLAMYSTSTFRLGVALDIGFLAVLSAAFLGAAAFAWCAVMAGCLRAVTRETRARWSA